MRRFLVPVVCVALSTALLAGQTPDPDAVVKQGRALAAQGKHDEAQRLYREVLKARPRNFDARLALGSCLDLQGQYAEARTHLSEAIKEADGVIARNQARTALAVSYAFESRAADAIEQLATVFNQQRADHDAAGAAATANAAGRIYLEAGDPVSARKWYDSGHEQAQTITDLDAGEIDLWEMRYLHARARIAAREGKADEARRQVAAFEQMMNRRGKQQVDNEIYRYLLGYVAYYAKDYDRAIAELVKGNLADPFIMTLLAMSYDAKGDTANAQQYYRRVLESNAHNLNMAFARPVARAKVRS